MFNTRCISSQIIRLFFNLADICANDPCFNNGKCVGIPGNYECKCMLGYIGYDCEGKCLRQHYLSLITTQFATLFSRWSALGGVT